MQRPTSVDILAEKLGISEDAALACLKALSMWGEVDFYNVDEVLDAIDQIGLSSDSLEGTAINISALTDQLIVEAGAKSSVSRKSNASSRDCA